MSSAQFYILKSKVTHCHLEHSYKLGDVDCREGEFNIPRHKLSEQFFLTYIIHSVLPVIFISQRMDLLLKDSKK